MDHAARLREYADLDGTVWIVPIMRHDLRAAADRLEAQAREIARLHYWLHTIRSHAGEIDVNARTALETEYIESDDA